jgi:hypothetical protein
VVDTQSGSVILGLNTESEYGQNGHTTNPRKEEEPWPTLLLEYACSENQLLNISNQREIRMVIEYELLKVEDKIPAGKTNTNLHTAQFQWYITVQNRNHSSSDYGRYIWFGLCFYDKRYDFTQLYASEDKGPNNTGAFIYVPAMRDIMGAQGKTEVGKAMVVDVDILPIIQTAYTVAQQRGYLPNTSWEELYIGGTNIGWEITGTYNAEVRIDSFNIKYSN